MEEAILPPNTDDLPAPIHPISSALVVGGCGFLGHHIVHQLLLRYKDVKVSVLDLRCRSNRFSDARVSYLDGDITDATAMAALFSELQPQVVIHTASPHFGAAKGADDLMYKVNVDGTKVLLAEAQRVGVRAFVYTSSASVVMKRSLVTNGGIVNADEEGWEVAERSDQWDWYMTTKALSESCVLAANRAAAFPNFLTTAIRPALLYGEGDVQALPLMLQAARRGQWRFQIGDNTNLFDTTYAGNAAVAHLLAAEALLYSSKLGPVPLDMERVDGEAFFVTNGTPITFWDFVRASWKEGGIVEPTSKVWVLGQGTAYAIGTILEGIMWAIGKQPNLTREKVMFSCIRRYYNIDKARERLGYKPVVSFEESIRRAVRDLDARGVGGLCKKTEVNGHANGKKG